MKEKLTQKEVDKIIELNRKIFLDSSCKYNCRTCRLDLLELMKEYLEIHDFEVSKK